MTIIVYSAYCMLLICCMVPAHSPYSDTLRSSCCSQSQSPYLSDSYRGRRSCDPTSLWDTANRSCRETHDQFTCRLMKRTTQEEQFPSHTHTRTQFNGTVENRTFSRSNGQSSYWDSRRCNRERSSACWRTSTRAHRGSVHMRQCSWCQSSL